MSLSAEHIVDVQFSGELLTALLQTVKTCTQRAHLVFGQHDLAVIGDAQHDDHAGPGSLISFRLMRHSADHYHVRPAADYGEVDSAEKDGDETDDLMRFEKTSIAVGVDLSAVLNSISGKHFKSASVCMRIRSDEPALLSITVSGRAGKKQSRLMVDTTMSPISVRHDYPAHSARSIVGQDLYNTFNDLSVTNKVCEIRYQGDEIIFEGKQKINEYSSVASSCCTLPVANPPPEAASFKAQGEFCAVKLKTFTKSHKLGNRINMYLNNGLPLVLEILLPKSPTKKKTSAAKRVTANDIVDDLEALSVKEDAECKECQMQLGVPLADTPRYVGYVRYSLRGDVNQKQDEDENDDEDEDDL